MVVGESETKQQVAYITSSIKHVIDTFGPRPPGSEGERNALEYIKNELKGYVDTSVMEDFELAPKAFMTMVVVVSTMMLISTMLYWVLPVASLLLMIGAFLVEALEFFIYKQFLDVFQPKRLSHNVIGIKKPNGSVKRRIILTGHADASYEYRYSKSLNAKLFLLSFLNYAITISISSLATASNFWWSNGYANVWGILGIIITCFVPNQILIIFYYRYSVVAPGANDNLSGTFIVMAIAKYFAKNDIHLDNTEIWYVITGSEEAGLRGAKAFAKAHAPEFRDVETACVVLDMLRDLDSIWILSSDLNNTVKLDRGIMRMLQIASKESGREAAFHPFPFGAGSTDAAAFQQGGIRTGSIVAIRQPSPAWYHTRLDTYSELNPDCIELGWKICIHAIKYFDEKGIPDSKR
ncbi:MAG: M28 family peptidase [Candidatus Lokiarchaeota archaeon]|nr:M28 family peptidase [Candidatus Lokiarchaeota archaeon]